jgi:hypothetical protein
MTRLHAQNRQNLTSIFFALLALVLLSGTGAAQNVTHGTLSDYKPGSILFYPKYTSNPSAPQLGDTQINITNTNQNEDITLHLFAVDGSSCSVADSFVSLSRNQTATILMSDFDPGVTGYLVAVAVGDGPTQFNFLIGDEYIRETDGRQANIQAIGVAKLTAGGVMADPDGGAALLFNGVEYERLPSSIGLSSFNSQVTDSTQVNLLIPTSNLLIGTPPPATRLFTIVYDDAENPFSTNVSVSCYATFLVSSLRITGGVNTKIPAGRTGWIRFSGSGRPVLGFAQNRGPVFNGGHNLHVLQLLSSYSITVPAF